MRELQLDLLGRACRHFNGPLHVPFHYVVRAAWIEPGMGLTLGVVDAVTGKTNVLPFTDVVFQT